MSRTLATLSLVLTSLFVIAVLALHILRPDVDPLVQGISYYGIGKFGWLLGLAASLMGLSGILLAISIWPTAHSTLGRLGLVLLVLWGITSILAGLFPLDAPGAAPTLSGRIHNLSGMNFLIIVPAVLLLEFQPTRDKAAVHPRPTTYWLAWLLLLAAISLFVFNGPMYTLHMGGVVQRLYWLVLVLWLFLKAAFIRSIERAPGS